MRKTNVKETRELNVSEVYEFYPMNIMTQIGYNSIRDEITEDEFIENFEALINNWLEKDDTKTQTYSRMAKVIVLRYKFYNTLDAVAKELGVTRERIRQIEHKALRIMCYPSYNEMLLISNRVKDLQEAVREQQHELELTLNDLKLEIANARTKIAKIQSLFEYEDIKQKFKELELEEEFRRSKFEIAVEELELSVRSYNCLRRAGIRTVYDLIQKSEEDMVKVRNLGRKSLKEIREKLHSMGLGFKNERIEEEPTDQDWEEEDFE